MPGAKTYTHIEFTITAYKPSAIQGLKECERIEHCLVKEHTGDKGSKWLQGWAKLSKRASLRHIETILEGVTDGLVDVTAKGKSKKADIALYRASGALEWDHSKAAFIAMDIDDTRSCSKKAPDDWARYHEAMDEVEEAAKQADERMKMTLQLESTGLREWQQRAAAYLSTQDEHTIDWYVDPKGGEGKTHLAKWLIIKRGAYYLKDPSEKTPLPDTHKEYIAFDLGREQERCAPYGLIEGFKRGTWLTSVESKPAKVIVFSNWEPDISAFAVRVNIVRLPEPSIWELSDAYMAESWKEEAPPPPFGRDIHSPAKRSLSDMQDTDL